MIQYKDLQFLNVLSESIILNVCFLNSEAHFSTHVCLILQLETREAKLTKPTSKVNQRHASSLLCESWSLNVQKKKKEK